MRIKRINPSTIARPAVTGTRSGTESAWDRFRKKTGRVVGSGYFLAVCLLIGFVLRIWWISLMTPQPVEDCRAYYDGAISLTRGMGYVNSAGGSTAYWPVGYPLFLSAIFRVFGESLAAARLANVLMYLGIMFFSYQIGKRLFSRAAGVLAVLILALYPNHILYMSLLLSETLLTFLILLAVTLLVLPRPRLHWAALSGLIFGFAALVKSQAIFVPAVCFLVFLIARLGLRRGTGILPVGLDAAATGAVAGTARKPDHGQDTHATSPTEPGPRVRPLSRLLVTAAVVHLFMALALMPWLVRNYRVFHHFPVLATNGGLNLLIGNNPTAPGRYEWNDEKAPSLKEVTGEYEHDQAARALAVDYCLHHPWATAKLWIEKIKFLYRPDRVGFIWNVRGVGGHTDSMTTYWMLTILYGANIYCCWLLIYGSALSLVLLLVFYARRRRIWEFPTLGVGIVLYFTVLTMAFFGEPRYHFPLIPWMAIYISGLVGWLLTPASGAQSGRSDAAAPALKVRTKGKAVVMTND